MKALPWNKKMEVLRTINGWSQEETADRCFVKHKTYWAWEKGNTYPRKINRRTIAKVFNITETEIFGEGEEKGTKSLRQKEYEYSKNAY